MVRRSVALLVETSNGYSRGLLEGVIEYTKQQAFWTVHLTEQERGASPPAWLSTWNGDGIIARIENNEIGEQLKSLGKPIVDLSAARHYKGIPWADTDDKAIARLAVEHFAERGFRHMAFCGDIGFNWSNQRSEHFQRLAEEAGFNVYVHHSVARYDRAFRPQVEKRRIIEWLSQLPKPIGIMGCYDFKAQQVLDACRELEIVVPTEVAVLGVDNDRLICELSDPTLSSIIPDTKTTGYEAADLLNRMMDGIAVDFNKPLMTQPLGIKLRESTDTLAIDDEIVAKALHFIRRNAAKNIRVADILKVVPLSRRALEHRFKKLVSRTPYEEIQRVRMNRIKELLLETDLPIQKIAELTGFEYSEYLAAAFKRETNQTPSDFRANSE